MEHEQVCHVACVAPAITLKRPRKLDETTTGNMLTGGYMKERTDA